MVSIALIQNLEEDAKHLKSGIKELWYADSSFHRAPALLKSSSIQTPQNINELSSLLAFLFVLIALSFGVYILYKKWAVYPDEEMPTNVDDVDYIAKIHEAEDKKNYRLALRFGYLQILKSLSQQSLIKYEKGKPNATYVYEIKNHKWGETFKEITRSFDYVWYGNYPIDGTEYFRLKDKFNALLPHV